MPSSTFEALADNNPNLASVLQRQFAEQHTRTILQVLQENHVPSLNEEDGRLSID